MGQGHLFTMAVTVVIWLGIFFYLMRIERKVSALEQDQQS